MPPQSLQFILKYTPTGSLAGSNEKICLRVTSQFVPLLNELSILSAISSHFADHNNSVMLFVIPRAIKSEKHLSPSS